MKAWKNEWTYEPLPEQIVLNYLSIEDKLSSPAKNKKKIKNDKTEFLFGEDPATLSM